MITRTALAWQHQDWQDSLRTAVRDPAELCRLLQLPEPYVAAAAAAHQDFPLRVPHAFIDRMNIGDPNDPLLRQVLPIDEELRPHPGYTDDPIGEQAYNTVPGLIHKYHGRALLMVNPACAVHCRYCFRRHFPYQGNNLSPRTRAPAINYLLADNSISEVILSGGDPLSSTDAFLSDLFTDLLRVPQLRRLRIHSRLPVVIPERITPELIALLTETRLHTVLVLHINHPAELNERLGERLAALRNAGVLLLNQTVLLKGVNESADTLAELSEKLFDYGVMPYYLHLLDPVAGSAHFAIADELAIALHKQLKCRLPGYLVPQLVRDGADRPYKHSPNG